MAGGGGGTTSAGSTRRDAWSPRAPRSSSTRWASAGAVTITPEAEFRTGIYPVEALKPTGAGRQLHGRIRRGVGYRTGCPGRRAARVGIRLDRGGVAWAARRPCRPRSSSMRSSRATPARPLPESTDHAHRPVRQPQPADRGRRARARAAELLQHRQARRGPTVRVPGAGLRDLRRAGHGLRRRDGRQAALRTHRSAYRRCLGRRARGRLRADRHRRHAHLPERARGGLRRRGTPRRDARAVRGPCRRARRGAVRLRRHQDAPQDQAHPGGGLPRSRGAGCWSPSSTPSVRAAGPDSRATSTTPIVCPTNRVTTRRTTSASARATARVCRCCSGVDDEPGDAYHIVDGSTVLIDKGYHPCAALPGYEMYYFTILGGLSQRSLKQYFQPTHAAQLETIPGIMDMVAKFE